MTGARLPEKSHVSAPRAEYGAEYRTRGGGGPAGERRSQKNDPRRKRALVCVRYNALKRMILETRIFCCGGAGRRVEDVEAVED